MNEVADINVALDGRGDLENDIDLTNNMYMLWAQNATGNHNRNHSISIPTKAGEPCRA